MARIQRAPTENEFRYVNYVEMQWHANKIYPSDALATKALNLPVGDIKELRASEVVGIMLENRGITIPDMINTASLTGEQLAAANCYLNIADNRPLPVKLKELGINPTRFYGWMKGKVFSAYLRERAEELFEDGMPFAHRELMTKVMQGDIKALTLYYQISGRHTGVQSSELQNVTVIIQRLLEAIQLEVRDPEVIDRVGKRFQSIIAGEPIAMEKVVPGAALPVGDFVQTDKPARSFNNQDERKVTVVRDGEVTDLGDAF